MVDPGSGRERELQNHWVVIVEAGDSVPAALIGWSLARGENE